MPGLITDIPLLYLIFLAIIQGITEFLPISSSAHLILAPVLTGQSDQGQAIDVAMHFGTLLAVMLYFRADVARLFRGLFDSLRGSKTPDARLTQQIIAATVPVVIAGFLLKDSIAGDWRSPVLIMVTTALFGVVLGLADRRADQAKGEMADLRWRHVLIIGLAQALALVPGVSRSGITMTAALFLGQKRPDAARFSLLLSIPTIAAAGLLAGYDLVQSGNAALQSDALIAGVLAFFSALLAIAGLMAWLRRASFMPFVLYRLFLAGVLAVLLLIGVI
ncbi:MULTISPECIES: undecaprenyl-diphosphate phosphatase [unclassified Iodidimonas]|uniref:undecaprenyl-diphosphate phosphatase n=1 Tax=unclassified Iodidimonas TaxID=2626145 RepID=UPI0024825FB3|nr:MULTISPECIES: undecaprenyl-diphosphate phosphatase [unclassified Iodidimonas]